MTRRSYQQGYVSDPIRTRQGTGFRIRYRIRDANSKSKHKSETLYGLTGKKEARAVLESRIKESENTPVEVTDITFADFLTRYWIPYLDRTLVKPSTRRSYLSALNHHILPPWGNTRVSDVTPLHVVELVQLKLHGGSSPKTVRNLLGLLQGIFSLAVDHELIPKSPLRKSHWPAKIKKEKPVWTATQLKSIVDGVPDQYRSLFHCVMLTGVRLGELLGLQWRHIDLVDCKLEIRQALWDGQLVAPKTAESKRTIYFGPALSLAFNIQKQNSRHTAQDDFVFAKSDGSPFHPDVLRRDVLYPVLDRLGIPRASRAAGFHTFRHSAATIVNERTGDLKLVQNLLGHSNLSTTADVYTHTSIAGERGAAQALEQAIFGNLFQPVPQTWNRNGSAATN